MKLRTIAASVAAIFQSHQQRFGLATGLLALKVDKAEHAKLTKDVQALYKEADGAYQLELPEGVEEVGGLKSALEKERDRAKKAEQAAKDLTKRFEGIDPDEVRKILERMGSDEERQLLKDGKIDEVVNRRMVKAQQAHEKALKTKDEEIAKAHGRSSKFEQRVLDNHIRAAAGKAGLHTNAVEDALFRARTIFKLDEEGNAVQLDGDGKAVLGKDGKTPFTPDEWLTGMKDSAPHWFPASNTGGGGTGDKGGRGTGKTIKRAEFDKLDPAARRQTVVDKVQIVD